MNTRLSMLVSIFLYSHGMSIMTTIKEVANAGQSQREAFRSRYVIGNPIVDTRESSFSDSIEIIAKTNGQRGESQCRIGCCNAGEDGIGTYIKIVRAVNL